MKIKYKLEIALLLIVLMIAGISTAGAFNSQTAACNNPGCHAYPPISINVTTNVTSTLTVSPGQSFTVNVSWNGGSATANTVAKWPTDFTGIGIVRNNSQFNPIPIQSSGIVNPSGSLLSVLTAPATPGEHTLRVYAARGSDSVLGKETNFSDINVTVTAPPVSTFNISGFKVNNATNAGISGWNITLKNSTMQTSMFTLSDGSYKFGNLVNGTYNVTEETQSGFTNVTPTTVQVVIAGSDMMNINFTNAPIITPPQATFNISGFKVNDTNGDNVWQPGENGIDKWNIMLLNATTGEQIASTSTDANGFYQFMNLMPGAYNVTEEMKDGFTPSGATFILVTIENRDVTDVDFLNHATVLPTTNSISGFKINDLNGNGKLDAGEKGLPGWNIRLIGIGPDTHRVKKETTTDENGFYSFENLPAGRYIVMETPIKRGYVPTDAPVKVVNLEDGTNSMNNNFMNRPISSLMPDLSGLDR